MKLEDAISTKRAIRTASGMYGFGSRSCAFITTENNNPIATAVSSRRPLSIPITGNASATQHNARST